MTANAVGGLVAAILVSVWRPFGAAALVSIALCFFAFGIWGIADRELTERQDTGPSALSLGLRVARVIAVVLGIAASLNFLYSALALSLGTWIS